MKRTIERITSTAMLVVAFLLSATSAWAGKLGEGITAYYDCGTASVGSGIATVTGKYWDSSSDALVARGSFAWTVDVAATAIGDAVDNKTGFGKCYSGGNQGGYCLNSTTCDGMCPGTSAGDWTFSCWVVRVNNEQKRLFVNSAAANILSSYDESNISGASSDNTGFGIYLTSTDKIGVRLSETTDRSTFSVVSLISTSAVSLGQNKWHNIVISRSGDTLTLYIDGVMSQTTTMKTGSYLVNPGCLTMANSTKGIGAQNAADDFCVWDRALSQGEVVAIAGGNNPISALAAEEFPDKLYKIYGSIGSSSNGDYISNNAASPTTVFSNLSLRDMITKYKISGYIGGGGISPRVVDGVYNAVLGTDALTVQFQKADGIYVKGTVVRFIQSGTDIKAYAVNCAYKQYSDASTASASLGVNLKVDYTNSGTAPTTDTEWGYGIYGITLTSLAAGESPLSITTGAKPLAVWNGDFPIGKTDERGGYTLDLKGNDSNGSVITIKSSANSSNGGVYVSDNGAGNYKNVNVIAGITISSSDISSVQSSNPFLFSSAEQRKNNTDGTSHNNLNGLFVGSSDRKIYGSWKGGTTGGGNQGDATYPDDGLLHRVAFCRATSNDAGQGTKGFIDGICVMAGNNYANRDDNRNNLGISIGGQFGNAAYNLVGATINNIAVFARTDETFSNDLSTDIVAWSLTEMTSAANFSNGEIISSSTDYSAVGINLNGGTVTLSGDVTAAAIFVQKSTTLSFANGATLTVGSSGLGPIYIAKDATLTIDATASSPAGNAAEDLVKGVFYGKSQVSVKTPAAFGSSLSDIGVQIGKYLKWSYANGILTWATPSSVGNNADSIANAATKYFPFDARSGEDDTENPYSNGLSSGGAYWQHFCYNSTLSTYSAPGYVLRFVSDEGNQYKHANITLRAAALTYGGLIVEAGATNYAIAQDTGDSYPNTRHSALGDPTGDTETWFEINEDFSMTRPSHSLMGTMNVIVNDGATFELKTGNATLGKVWSATTGQPTLTTNGGELKMHGAGTFKMPQLTANGSTLDYSDLAPNRASAFINGALVIDSSTQFRFPANAVFPYPVASSISGLTDVYTTLPAANYTVGGVAGTTPLLLFADGTAIPSESAQTATITTDGTYTLAGLFSSAPTAASDYTINVNESATLNIPSPTTVFKASFVVAEGKTLTITGSTLTAALGISVTGSGRVYMSGASRFLGKIKGNGRVVFDEVLPDSSMQTSLKDSSNWTGTVELKGYTAETESYHIINLNKYGNVNSTVALNGVKSTMYAQSGNDNYPDVALKEIEIGEGGWSDWENGSYGTDMLYKAKLTGHGPLTVQVGGSGIVKFIGDHTFDGPVSFGSSNTKGIAFMRTSSNPTVASAAIFVAEGLEMSIASGKTWTADGGFVINGTLNVNGTLASSAKSVSGSGTVVFTGKLPPSDAAANAWWKNTAWTGKVEIKDYEQPQDDNAGIIELNNYGNGSSAVALNGVKSLMYATGTGTHPAVTLRELEIGDGGWTDLDYGEFNAQMEYNAKLTGHGLITVKSKGGHNVKFIGNHTFDGSVAFGANTGKQVAFMKKASDSIPAVTAKAIVVAGGLDMSIASGKTWAAEGGIKIDGTLTVKTSEKATATSGTISACSSGAQIEETADATADITTYASITSVNNTAVEISDNQASLGDVSVQGASSLSGSGGAYMRSLAIKNDATLTYDPVITPLRVESAPVFEGTGKLKLAARYAGVTCGKFHLVTYPASASVSVSGTLNDLVDSTSFNNATYTVTEEPVTVVNPRENDSLTDYTKTDYKQLVLKIGDYDTAAKPMTIAQFGDSITEGIFRNGYRGTPNYRIPLMQLLEAYGYKPEARGYREVGSEDANGVKADDKYAWHTGISAQRIYTGMTGVNLRAGFMESIEAHLEQVGVTDIITLKIGTNDSIGSETADNMFEGWTNLVWKIVRMRPTSKIVVCAPIKIRSGEKNAPGLRTKIADYVAKTAAEGGFPDGQVTMINGIEIVTDDANYYLTDNVHPNWNGHLQLANAWLPAVTNAFESMKVNDVIVHAAEAYTAQPAVDSAEDVDDLAVYRAGYIKLATFTGYNTKLNTWGESPYDSVNDTYKDTPMSRVAYFVARKTTASPDTRYVWVDMDADATTGTTLANFGVPTSASVNGVVNNLHIYSNSSAIENVAPTPLVSGVKGTLMLTEKSVSKADSISTELAPTGPYGYDWNDTVGSSTWGAMDIARIFTGAAPTDHRKLLAAQMLFEFNGFNGSRQNALGLGDFAVHGPYEYPNGSVEHFNLDWTFSTAKDEMPTMDVNALDSGVIEIWGKLAYTVSMAASANFSGLEFSPTLPVDTSACDLIVNVTANSTLTFNSAKSVGSIRFNIAKGVTLKLANTSNLSGAVIISGPGKLQLDSSATFARMEVASNATVGFASGATLGVSGALYVASGATLTLVPAAISTASSTIISAASISGTVSVTLPEESGVDYSTIATETSYKIVRTPNVAFSYDGTIGAAPTGWFTDVLEPFSSNLRIGPDSSKPIVYEVKDDEHPYNTAVTWAGKSATIALYADISQVANTGKPVLVGIGASGEDNKDFILLYRDADKVKLAVWNVGVYSTTATHMVGTAASVDVPSAGYHLYTATFTPDGALTLYCDSVAGTAGSAGRAIDILAGFQIGNLFKGVANGTWSRCSGDHGLTKGLGMAFAAIRGYDAVLGPDNVAKLAESFPAVSPLNPDWNIIVNKANDATFTACDAAMTQGHTLQVHRGAFVIPEGNTLSVPILRTLNINSGSPTITATIDGTLDITGTSGKNVWNERGGANPGGIVFGEWYGSGTYTISSTGKILAPNSYLQTVKSAGTQTITVNGGVIAAKGIWADTGNTNSSITLQNGGALEVSDIPSDGGAITKNFGNGTFRVKADATETRAINFSAASGYATTLDPFGNTLTLQSAALTGSGDITVNDSSDGHAGKVVFVGGSGYTGRLIMTDANAANIDISGYTGTVLCQGTAAETIAKFDGFTGKVYFTGNVDATGFDLSGATVNIADNCTFTADAGKEGTLVLGSGAAVTLNVTQDVADYEGYFPKVSGGGTIGYYQTDGTPGALTGADHVNGNNLMPYYNVWVPSQDGNNNTISADAATRWRLTRLPDANKNVAFKLDGDATVTIDETITFKDIQVYGTGKLTIQQSGDNVLTVGNALYTTANAGVQIDSGLAFGSGAMLEIDSAVASGKYVGVNCGTAESPFEIPFIDGSGLLIIAEGKGLTTGSMTVGTLTVQGKLALTGAGSATTASVSAGGVVDVGAGVTLTAPTLAVNGTVNMASSTSALSGVTALSGAGSVTWTGKQPDGTIWKDAASWTGTNIVMSTGTTIKNLTPENWGRNGSFIVMKNLNGFIDTNNATVQAKVIFENGDNGYALAISDGYGGRRSYFREIAGNGTIKDVGEKPYGDGGGAQLFVFKAASEFTGSIINLGTTGKNFTKIFVFSSNKTDSAGDIFGRIIVEADGSAVIGDGEEWNTQYGAIVGGNVTLQGEATMAKVTFNNGATLKLSGDTAKYLTTTGTLTWPSSGAVTIDASACASSAVKIPVFAADARNANFSMSTVTFTPPTGSTVGGWTTYVEQVGGKYVHGISNVGTTFTVY